MLDDDVRTLARSRSLGVLTTLMPGGQPQVSLVWPHADEQHVLIGTQTTRQKYRNLVTDPRATILLLDSENSRRYVEVRGRVVDMETGDTALALARTTFGKWTGSTTPRAAEGERVLLRLAAEHIHRKD